MYRWEEHNGYLNHHHLNVSVNDVNNAHSTIIISSSSPSHSSSSSSSSSPPSTHGYIEHTISKLDTLAGIAIKYGLEVAEIKKLNSLITDHQMFALKTIRIPLNGRHPPSPDLSNGRGNSDNSVHDDTYRELFESFLSPKIKSSGQKLSPVTSSGYYATKPTMKKSISVFEMAMYRKRAYNSSENGSHSPTCTRTLSRHQKSRSFASEIFMDILENSSDVEAKEDESDKWNDIFVNNSKDNNSGGRFCSSRTGKSLALRQKSGNRTALTTDSKPSSINPLLTRLGSAFALDEQSGVRKSSSTSCLQHQLNNRNPSSNCRAVSAKGIAKPRTGKRNKAALD